MDARTSQSLLSPTVNSAQCQDQNGCEPLPEVPRLILQCDNGVHVPLVILPDSYDAGVVGSERIVAPDSSCGFGVVPFPKSYCASAFRRVSPTSMADMQLWSCETGPGVSGGDQRFDKTKASLRSCDSDSASASRACHAAGPAVDNNGKIIAQNVLKAIVSNNPSVADKYGYCPTLPGIQPDIDKKSYCTYWIRTGECDYTQQGCRYKHEVPDLETLNRIGFRDFPLWWKRRLFKRHTRPQNDALKRIMAQPADSEDSSSGCDADSEKSLPIASSNPAMACASKDLRAVLDNRVDAPGPTPESPNLIDLELVNHELSEQRLATVGSVIRGGQFVPFNDPRPVTSSSSGETLHPLPPSHIRSLITPMPTVPQPSPATSPEPKPAAPIKGKARSKNVPDTAFLSLFDQQPRSFKTVVSADTKNIKPLDLHRQIEKLQHNQREIEILAAGVDGAPSFLASANNDGLKASKYAKPWGLENISIQSDTPGNEEGKKKKSKRSKRSTKARKPSPAPVPQLTPCKPRKPAKLTDNGSAK